MKIATFNVNGIRSRLHQVKAVVDKYSPDLIALQETKCVDDAFPIKDIEEMGYHAEMFGQKGYHGVAILSKKAPKKVQKGFATDDENAQKRFISVEYDFVGSEKLTFMDGYFPQGESRSHPEKFPCKRKFYADLLELLKTKYKPTDNILIVGDMNVAPNDKDIGIGEQNAKRWLKTGKCSFLPEEREWVQALVDWGTIELYRAKYPDSTKLSWFDYRSAGFESNPKHGLRIDLLLGTKSVLQHCVSIEIDHEIRGMEKPSDHCPIIAEFK